MAKTSLSRKKFMPFPPNSMAPSTSVSVAAGGMTAQSFGTGAITAAAIAANALVGQIVNSVQTGSISLPGGTLLATAAITTVDVNKSVLLFGGNSASAAAGGENHFCNAWRSAANEVSASRQASVGTDIVRFTILEFK